CARWLSCLHCLHCRLTARRSWVRFPHGALLALGGSSSPDLQCSGAFPCGVCMFSPRSQGVSSTKNLNKKTCKRTEHMSIFGQGWTVHFTWSPGATSCPLLLGGP